jgi:endonuclease/exonuclease/phosphatase family metal-dependent hydrolase
MKIKILSYNIHKGFTITNQDFILDKIKSAIKETNADILFLQEVLGHHEDERCKIPEWETAIQFEYLADNLWPHFAYGKNAIYAEGHHGNAILSKFPIQDWSNHVISTNRFEHRGLLKAKVSIPGTGQDILLANTHLDLTQKGRDQQAGVIIEHFLAENSCPWILVGDFNDWNFKISKRIEKELEAKEVFKYQTNNYPRTFPSVFPILSLDRIFIKNLNIVSCQRLSGTKWSSLSDHLPLLVEVDTLINY